ncbi:MAG: hypothetical protein ACYC91_13280 [Solirubrobacteraceae bacterium]
MAFNPIRTVSKAASERALGLGPGPVRAAVAATITGAATAALTHRVLRSEKLGGSGD